MQASERCFLTACLSAALIAASMMWATPARAQGNTAAPPSTGAPQAPSTKLLSDTAPKAILVDPCKAKTPPSYCGKH